jgi:radical SAM/Cys-rich protein
MKDPREQVRRLSQAPEELGVPSFISRLNGPLVSDSLTTLQINLGKMCNQTCKHCHVDAGPTRKEIMSRETMRECLAALDRHSFQNVDLTGGAPEMNPHFRWFVEEIAKRGVHIMVRCNLTIIEAHEKFGDLPEFFARHQVEVISSLPFYSRSTTDRQRGDGVFDKSIAALKKLNSVGYGREASLKLNLVYNPNGAFLPADQDELESQYKSRLREDFGIEFHRLFTITNMPISRFLEYLIDSGNFAPYMRKLSRQFNPQAAENVMCRSLLSVSWDGRLFDCDFNQMLEIPCASVSHISQFDASRLERRNIAVNSHCYGCTAGAGSSCGGTVA